MQVPELQPEDVEVAIIGGRPSLVVSARIPSEIVALARYELSDREGTREVLQWLAKVAGGEAVEYVFRGNAHELVIDAGGATVTNFLLPELGSWELTLPSLCLILTVWLRALGGPGGRAH